MPRDGSGIYTTPAGTTAVPDTTIESSKYNGNVADVAADLNAARPIVAGGTGATSASAARTNLGAEARGVQVTNYDTHVFEAGSFWSNIGATAAPNASHHFLGICYVYDGANVVIEARNLDTANPGELWIRRRYSGTWGAWVNEGVTSADYVKKVGDTMTGQLSIGPAAADAILALNAPVGNNTNITLHYTGARGTKVNDINFYAAGKPLWTWRVSDDMVLYRYNDAGAYVDNALVINRATANMTLGGDLTISKNNPSIILDRTDATDAVARGRRNGSMRWAMALGNGTAEGGSNAGSDFALYRYADNGAFLGTAFDINRATGAATFGGALTVGGAAQFNGAINSAGSITSGPGQQTIGNYVTVRHASDPTFYMADAGGANKGMVYHNIATGRTALYNGSKQITLEYDGRVDLPGITTKAGFSAGFNPTASVINFNWTGTLQAWVDTTNVGTVAFTSDYRTKKDVADLPSTWDAVKALRPVSYTQAQYTPQIEIERKIAARIEAREKELDVPQAKEGYETLEPMFPADDVERWGFIAHEMQETLVESAATGVKDSPDTVQSPNPWTMLAAVTKALQEAMARIEALEAAASVPVR